MPAITDWPTAVTTTPSATPRIAWPASTTAARRRGHRPRAARSGAGVGPQRGRGCRGRRRTITVMRSWKKSAPMLPSVREEPIQGLTRVGCGLRREVANRLFRVALPRGSRVLPRRAGPWRPYQPAGAEPRRSGAGRPSRRSPPGSRGSSRAPRGTGTTTTRRSAIVRTVVASQRRPPRTTTEA